MKFQITISIHLNLQKEYMTCFKVTIYETNKNPSFMPCDTKFVMINMCKKFAVNYNLIHQDKYGGMKYSPT